MALELSALVDRDLVRVLDLLFLKKEIDRSVEAFKSHEFDDSEVGQLRELETDLALVLAAEDVDSIGAALAPGSSAAVLIWENTWAAPSALPCAGPAGSWWPAAGSPSRPWRPRSMPTNTQRKESEMLGGGRVGRRGVLGGRPVARTAAVPGTAAVVARGVGRRGDRREDRRDRRDDRRPFR